MTNGARGAQRERKVRAFLEARGWWTSRAAGSHGESDVVALRAGQTPMLIQVKSDRTSALAHFGPAERRALVTAADQAGARPVLCWYPPDRKPPRWFHVSMGLYGLPTTPPVKVLTPMTWAGEQLEAA